jgi:hypothetical protein
VFQKGFDRSGKVEAPFELEPRMSVSALLAETDLGALGDDLEDTIRMNKHFIRTNEIALLVAARRKSKWSL